MISQCYETNHSDLNILFKYLFRFLFSFKFEWKNAQKYLEFLRKESRWSPAIYTYAYALNLYMQYLEDGETDNERLLEIHDLMKYVLNSM